jgi:hypothetical protein
MQEVVLDSEEMRHLKICSDCQALLRRFVEYERGELAREYEGPGDLKK